MSLTKIIQSSFTNCSKNDCHEIVNVKYFEIVDDGINKCYVNKDKGKGQFKVKNYDSKEINFLKIDKCLFEDSLPPKRCDFALFDDITFSFIEIKEPSNISGRRVLKREAIEQLKSTIIQFLALNIFEKYRYELEAIICIVGKKSYPTITSTKLSKVKEFQDEFNVLLSEGNFKKY